MTGASRAAKAGRPPTKPAGPAVPPTPREMLESVWPGIEPELRRTIAALGVDAARVADVLQDVYLAAWRKPPPEIEPAELRRWLFRVAINRCHLEHRRASRWRRVVESLGRLRLSRRRSSQESEAASALVRQEEKELVRAALGRLDPQVRTVLVLRYVAEFDSKEIGQILDLPDSTVRSRLRAARTSSFSSCRASALSASLS